MRSTAQIIFDKAQLGAKVSYSDGSKRPADRHRHKLREWDRQNGVGYITERRKGYREGDPSKFTLRSHVYAGERGIIEKEFGTDSPLTFTRIGGPEAGEILCILKAGQSGSHESELHRVVRSREEASAWALKHQEDEISLVWVLPGDFTTDQE